MRAADGRASLARRAGLLAAAGLVGLCAWSWDGGPAVAGRRAGPAVGPGAGPAAGPVARWLGPIAALAASAEWVRWTTALGRGELARAHAAALRALALDPGSPEGWLTLAQHLVFDRASTAMEPDRARRTAFARAGLDVLRRGEERARDAAGLALVAGDIAVFLAERARPIDAEGAGDLDWAGGPSALLDEAEASYTRALAHGHADAAERLARLAAMR